MLFRLLLLTLIPLLLLANTDRSLQMMKIEQRVALVIGNNEYDSERLSRLKNPVNDARAMKSKLKSLGFKVEYGENLTVRAMDKKLRSFASKLKGGGVGLFFFAGHGVESQGENYLIGKDSALAEKDEIAYESLELSKVLDKMQNSGNRLNIVLLDACRNDPFSRSGGGGLAKSTARGTYIAYATSPGDVASDGNGNNGVFTSQILKNIDAPGVPIERVFKNVKRGVLQSTNDKQRPWISNDITGDFYFRLPSNGSTTAAVPTTTQKSSFSFEEEAPTAFSLKVNVSPSDANVQITNIAPNYYDGIKLKKGSYNIRVSKSGYKTKNGTVNLQGNMEIAVNLEKEAYSAPKQKSMKCGSGKCGASKCGAAKPVAKKVYVAPKQNSSHNTVIVSGLMWQDEPYTEAEKKAYDENKNYGKIRDWEGAIEYCQNLQLDGYDDWRLPTKEELESIVDLSRIPTIKKEFKNAASSYYWSSSPGVARSKYDWSVSFSYGGFYYNDKTDEFYVRCARAGQ